MDCGPASLKCLLEGFGTPVGYGRLREACQTGIDGTSIDTMETVANQLGLEAEQIMLPVDHLLLDEAKTLPADCGREAAKWADAFRRRVAASRKHHSSDGSGGGAALDASGGLRERSLQPLPGGERRRLARIRRIRRFSRCTWRAPGPDRNRAAPSGTAGSGSAGG